MPKPKFRTIATVFLAFLPLVVTGPHSAQEAPVTVQVKEWVQREWTHPGASLYRDTGDFYNATGLLPTTRDTLKRGPSWATHVDLPAGIVQIRGMFYDEAKKRYIVIGSDSLTPTKIVLAYYSSAWSPSSVTDLVTGTAILGGRSLLNVAYWGGDLYIIAADRKVYRGSSYTSALSAFYSTTDAHILVPLGDRMYLITNTGKVLRLASADNAFETHYDPIGNLDPIFATPFRGYLAIFSADDDGALRIYRLPDAATDTPATLQEIASIPGATGDPPPTYGSLFTAFDDSIYFCPGLIPRPDSDYDVHIYRYNGSQVDFVASLVTGTADTTGLVRWRNYLLYYALNDGAAQTIKVLAGDSFIDFTTLTTHTSTDYISSPGSLGGEFVVAAHDETNGEGIYHAGADGLYDGSVETAWLDMGSPAREKRLARICAQLDRKATDLKVGIAYAVNGGAYNAVAETNNATRACRDTLSDSFYTLKLKITINDDTGNNQDVNIDALSVIYTIGDE